MKVPTGKASQCSLINMLQMAADQEQMLIWSGCQLLQAAGYLVVLMQPGSTG